MPTEHIPWTTTGQFMLGLISVLSVVGLALWAIRNGKAIFGRSPPFEEELERRDKSIRRQIYMVEKNLQAAHGENLRRIELVEQRYEELQIDRQRKWQELTEQLASVRVDVAFIRGNCKQCINDDPA